MSNISHQNTFEQVTKHVINRLSQISPKNLQDKSHAQNLHEFVDDIVASLVHYKFQFILIIEAIKETKEPCYKRDLLIEALEHIVFSPVLELFHPQLACDEANVAPKWKVFANAITSIPELVANCDSLNKYCQYQPSNFYSRVLARLENVFKHLSQNEVQLNKLFYAQILIRISLIDHGQLVWDSLTKNWIDGAYDETSVKDHLPKVLTCPLDIDNSVQFDVFPAHLYIPIFQNAHPQALSGKKFLDLLGEKILINEDFDYTICNKLLHQLGYKLDREQQYATLFNIFSYFAAVSRRQIIAEPGGVTLIVKNFLELARCWSERHKIMLRTLENSRYITCALVIAYRSMRELSSQVKQPLNKLLDGVIAKEIQSRLMLGIQIHLDRASSDQRSLAMALGEVLLPKLNELLMSSGDGSTVGKQNQDHSVELNFGVELGEDFQEIKKLLTEPYGSLLFHSPRDIGANGNNPKSPDSATSQLIVASQSLTIKEKEAEAAVCSRTKSSIGKSAIKSNKDGGGGGEESGRSSSALVPAADLTNETSCSRPAATGKNQTVASTVGNKIQLQQQLSQKRVVELMSQEGDDDNNDGDLKPCQLEDNDDVDTLTDCSNDKLVPGEDIEETPMYLRDCINGLAESDKPRYIQLCLIKAGELIVRLANDYKRQSDSEEEARRLAFETERDREGRHVGFGSRGLESNSLLSSKTSSSSSSLASSSLVAVSSGHFLLFPSNKQQLLNCSLSASLLLTKRHNISGTSGNSKTAKTSKTPTSKLLDSRRHAGSTNRRHCLLANDAIRDVALELARVLLFLDDPYHIKDFHALRMKALINLTTAAPDLVAKYLLDEYNDGSTKLSIRHQLDVLHALVSSAQLLSNYVAIDTNNKAKEKKKTTTTNALIKFAQLYFYGIVNRLKVDLIDRVSPMSIVSSIKSSSSLLLRKRDHQSHLQIGGGGASLIGRDQNQDLLHKLKADGSSSSSGRRSGSIIISGISGDSNYNCDDDDDDNDNDDDDSDGDVNCCTSAAATAPKQRSTNDEATLDDSYLLSRILVSVSLVLRCLDQQPIMCKLSRDLLDILAAYRSHPDLGVRQSMLACAIVIRQCCPRIYYEDNLRHQLTRLGFTIRE